ncbi:Uncharacterised protein [Bordetella pertussis]|nr:Uncharacterised protein [Bordetella pertussis]CFW34259.1 Uncharacterised protein [Bordetella pertussis]
MKLRSPNWRKCTMAGRSPMPLTIQRGSTSLSSASR